MHQYDETTGVVFYSQVGVNGVACWNTAKPFTENNHPLIASDANRMIYPADLNVCRQLIFSHIYSLMD